MSIQILALRDGHLVLLPYSGHMWYGSCDSSFCKKKFSNN